MTNNKVKKYSWAWYDGEGNYSNTAPSMEHIIRMVVDYYFAEESDVCVVQEGESFIITYNNIHADKKCTETIGADEDSVVAFLEELAQSVGRVDEFGICEI